jgi:hypothetical protein
MIVELAEKLIDRCIQLLRARQDKKRALLADFVEPLMTTFDELHNLYVRTFREAHETIAGAVAPNICNSVAR